MTQLNRGLQHDECGESLSRLIDGELDPTACRALFSRLERDADARRTWVLLNVACDAVRSNETAALHSASFVARFGAALDAEPTILAPRALRRRRMLLRRVALPSAAVAAAALVLAVVAVPQLRGTTAQSVPGTLVKTQPSLPRQDVVIDRSLELEAYLSAHRESAAGPVSSRSADFILPAAVTAESR